MPDNTNQSMTDDAAEKASALGDKIAEGAEEAHNKLADFGRRAANSIDENISATAAYVRDTDGGRMMHDLKRVVRNHPGPSVLAAVAVGFLVGRAITRNAKA